MNLVVYADFNSPECYLASRRVSVLTAAGVAVDWRAVQGQRNAPVSGMRLRAEDQNDVRERFQRLEALLLPGEVLPWSTPTFVPNTEASVCAYAEVYGSRSAADVRRVLFELYWRDGVDIGNPTVLRTPLAGPVLRAGLAADPLRHSGYAVSAARGPITTDAYIRIQSWRREWQALGGIGLPVLLTDSDRLSGVDAVERLGKEIARVATDIASDAADPRRYPKLIVKPPPGWVSEIGGSWRHAYQLSDTS